MTTPANQFRQLSDPVKAIQYREGMHHGELHIIIDHLTDGKSHLQTRYPGCVPYLTTGSTAVRLEPGCWIVARSTGAPAVYADQAFRDLFISQTDVDRLRVTPAAVGQDLGAGDVVPLSEIKKTTPDRSIGSQITNLTAYLDARIDETGGYALNIKHYDFRRGNHIVDVQLFPETLERAMKMSDALDMEFARETGDPHHYEAKRDGVRYSFQLDAPGPVLGAEGVSSLSEISKPANDKAEGTR